MIGAPSCMGGGCLLRERCPLYHAGTTAAWPSERICARGWDGYPPDTLQRRHPGLALAVVVMRDRAEERIAA